MKISVIMCVLNSMPYIMASIKSFKEQKYKNKELIIVHSKSNDTTDEYLKSIKSKDIKKISFEGNIYKSLNFGIKKAKGQIIGILHSDDVFYDEFVLRDISNTFKKKKSDIVYGNIIYSKKNDLLNIVRSWKEIKIRKKYHIPPHTGTFVKKKICEKYKYETKYKISGDTDFLIKIFKLNFKYHYLNRNITIMRYGGISTNISFIFLKFLEDYKIFKKNNLGLIKYIFKVFDKLNQLSVSEKLLISKYLRKINETSKVKFLKVDDLNKVNGKIISALNLAFITYNYQFKFRSHNFMFWPDGIFANFYANKKKTPGRKFFKKIINFLNKSKKKNKIYILGNLPNVSKSWMSKELKSDFDHIKLPYGNIKTIKKNIYSLRFENNSLVILTLPTPKQEIIGNIILKKNAKLNIICIGGSINILSGYETEAPEIFNTLNMEWLWRLRFDTKRRFMRLMQSFILLCKIKILNKNDIF